MNVISCLRLLRFIPAAAPGKSRLSCWMIERLAHYGEAEIPALGLSFVVPALREPIASSLLANGTYEPLLCEALAQVLKKDGVFMDVGANVGLFSLLAAHRLAPEGRVAAFEASPRIFTFLERNAQKNPSPSLTLFHRAVTTRSGEELSFFDAPDAKFGMGSLANRFSSNASVVKSISLDDAAEQLRLPRVDAIKVDVEGFELGVFQGARRLLSMTPAPVVFFEFNDWAEANATSTPGDAQRYLQELGYVTLPLEDWMQGDRSPRAPQTSGGENLVAFKPKV